MLMNWPKELEARLADDPRFERGKSRFSEAVAFFHEGKEIAYFEKRGLDIRLTASGIFALQARLTRDSVVFVRKDWVLLRVESEEELEFAWAVLERAVREAYNPQPGPKGKQTRRSPAKKSAATEAFGIAKALKALEEMDPGAKPKRKKPKE